MKVWQNTLSQFCPHHCVLLFLVLTEWTAEDMMLVPMRRSALQSRSLPKTTFLCRDRIYSVKSRFTVDKRGSVGDFCGNSGRRWELFTSKCLPIWDHSEWCDAPMKVKTAKYAREENEVYGGNVKTLATTQIYMCFSVLILHLGPQLLLYI
jgi:hypothetical protein